MFFVCWKYKEYMQELLVATEQNAIDVATALKNCIAVTDIKYGKK